MTLTIVLIIALIGALLAAGFLGWHLHKFIQRFETIEQISKRRKLPYPAMAGLEDAIALADDGQFESVSMDRVIACLLTMLQKDVAARKYLEARLGQVQDVLKTVRSDPQGYDVNQPSKKEE